MGRNNIKHKWKRLDQRSLGFLSKEINGDGVQKIDSLSAEVQRDISLVTKNQFSELISEDFEEEHREVHASEPPHINCSAAHRLTSKASVDLNSVSHGVAAGYSSVPSSIRPIRDSSLQNQVAVSSKLVKSKSAIHSSSGDSLRDPQCSRSAIPEFRDPLCSRSSGGLTSNPDVVDHRVSTSISTVRSSRGQLQSCDQDLVGSAGFPEWEIENFRSDDADDPDYFPSENGISVSTSLANSELGNSAGNPDFASSDGSEKGKIADCTQHASENAFSDLGWDLRNVKPDSSIKIIGKNFDASKLSSLQNIEQQCVDNIDGIDFNVAESGAQIKKSGHGGMNNLFLGNSKQVALDNQVENIHPIENGNCEAKLGGNKIGEAKMIKDWKSLFSGNRKVNSGLSLKKFVSSSQFVELKDDDFELSENYEWHHCLVGYFSGKFPGFNALKNLVALTWKVQVSIHRHDSGWIIFKFHRKEDMDGVMQNGPYTIFGRSLILKIMPRYFSFDASDLSCFPVWIQVKNLPLSAWSPIPLGKILSFIGTPLCMDKVTATRERISFVGALVEVDVSHELPTKVDVKLPDNCMRSFPIVYENLPLFCNLCKRIGHEYSSCSKATKVYFDGSKNDISNKMANDGDNSARNIGLQGLSQLHGDTTVLGDGLGGSLVKPLPPASPNSVVKGGGNELSVQKNVVQGLSVQHENSSSSCAGKEEVQGLFGAIGSGLSVYKQFPSVAGNNGKNSISHGNDVSLFESSESSQEKAVRTCKKSGFEIKLRDYLNPNGDGSQCSLLHRFINVFEHAGSKDMMDNWVNYMEESLVSLEAG